MYLFMILSIMQVNGPTKQPEKKLTLAGSLRGKKSQAQKGIKNIWKINWGLSSEYFSYLCMLCLKQIIRSSLNMLCYCSRSSFSIYCHEYHADRGNEQQLHQLVHIANKQLDSRHCKACLCTWPRPYDSGWSQIHERALQCLLKVVSTSFWYRRLNMVGKTR